MKYLNNEWKNENLETNCFYWVIDKDCSTVPEPMYLSDENSFFKVSENYAYSPENSNFDVIAVCDYDSYSEANKTIENLRIKNKAFKEALQFYAFGKNISMSVPEELKNAMVVGSRFVEKVVDHGETAANCLKYFGEL